MEPAPQPRASLRAGPLALGGAVGLLLALAYAPSLDWLWGRWRTDPFYSHGPLVPVVSLVLVWSRRTLLAPAAGNSLGGLGLVGLAAALHLLGARLRFEFLSVSSLVATVAGLALLVGGRELLRRLRFPLLFLFFAIPLPLLVIQQVSLPLELFSARTARAILAGLGCDVARQGVFLVFPRFTLAVADACSGLRSLLTVLALSTLVAHLSPGSPLRKTALVLASSAAAVALNVLRITLTGLIGVAVDGATATLVFERYSGYVFLALVALSTIGLFRFLGDRPAGSPPEPPAEPAPAQARPSLPSRLAFRLLLPLVAVTLPAGLVAGRMSQAREAVSPTRLAGWEPEVPPWRTVEVCAVAAHSGEEALAGRFEGDPGLPLRWGVLHSVSGRYLHSPEACSSAAGWVPELQEIHEAPGAAPVHLWILRRGTERACVVYWFIQDGVDRRGSFQQHLGAIARRLWKGTVDSAYGEVVLPLPAGRDPDRERLLEAARGLHRAVRTRLWPGG